MHALGNWTYKPSIRKEWDWGFYGDEDATWTGTFEGGSFDVFIVKFRPSGSWGVIGLIFFEGEVNGKEGSLTILFVDEKTEEWLGWWRILCGEGELANLRGRGTWCGLGAAGPGDPGEGLEYSGWIFFRRIRKWW